MISNTDDHFKNHGFLMHNMKNHHYSLSPLFDVLPHGSRALYPKEHAIAVGAEGRIGTAQNLLSRCNAFGCKRPLNPIPILIRFRFPAVRQQFFNLGHFVCR